jgi:acetyl esterase
VGYEFDAEIAPLVAAMPQFSGGTIEETRALLSAAMAALPPYEPPVPLTIVDDVVPAAGSQPEVPVRLYAPAAPADASTPCALYLHGGAFTVGNLDTEHRSAARLAAEAGIVVVSVDYRLAPEHPFPAAVHDCAAALAWVADRARELRVDRDRIAVRGASAGGGLAAALALHARDHDGPPLCFQVLLMPELDDRLETPSMRQFVDTPMWDRGRAETSWTHYLGTVPGSADVSPYAAPGRALDLTGLPPAYVSVCEFDPLRDEGMAYAQRLVQAGVHTELHLYPGTFHGSTQFEDVDVTRRMHADELLAVRRALHGLPAT